jgi:hypothetical protein
VFVLTVVIVTDWLKAPTDQGGCWRAGLEDLRDLHRLLGLLRLLNELIVASGVERRVEGGCQRIEGSLRTGAYRLAYIIAR